MMIIIEDETTKAQYAVQPEDYEREKDGAYAGYTIVSNEDGTPVESAEPDTAEKAQSS
jgi:hypothetical protein